MRYGVELYKFTSLKESVGGVNLGSMRGQVSICTIRIRIWSGARKNCTKTDSTGLVYAVNDLIARECMFKFARWR